MGKTLKQYADWRLQESMREYAFYQKRFKRMLLSMFKWENLPDGINARFIEKTLYDNGVILFHKDKGGFFRVSQCTQGGQLNSYDEPILWHTIDINGNTALVKASESVAIYNDFLREGNALNVNFFAKRLSNIEKTIDVNLEQLKQPVIISCSENQKKTAELLWQSKTNGQPVIFVDDSALERIQTQILDLRVSNHIPDLEETKHEYENECLTFFGINNVNVIKKERLVTGETDQNNEQIFLNLNAMLKPRQDAVKQINDMFGLDIKVSVEKDAETIVKGGVDIE